MQVTGTLILINETQTFGNNGFRKRDAVVETSEQYPQKILIEFVQDRTDDLNNFAEGQEVVVSINLRGREWTNPQGEVKYFNSIQGWKIEKAGEADPRANSAVDKYEGKNSQNQGGVEPDDDLPFSPIPNY